MPQFKNTADLMAYLKKAVDESLTNDVFPVIRDEEVEAIKDIVYSMDTSGYYQRRYDFGGIGDPYNIVIKGNTAQNGILSVINITDPNPYLNGRNGDIVCLLGRRCRHRTFPSTQLLAGKGKSRSENHRTNPQRRKGKGTRFLYPL